LLLCDFLILFLFRLLRLPISLFRRLRPMAAGSGGRATDSALIADAVAPR
jgi:hypothetical protein